jgi:hypothetical protein
MQAAISKRWSARTSSSGNKSCPKLHCRPEMSTAASAANPNEISMAVSQPCKSNSHIRLTLLEKQFFLFARYRCPASWRQWHGVVVLSPYTTTPCSSPSAANTREKEYCKRRPAFQLHGDRGFGLLSGETVAFTSCILRDSIPAFEQGRGPVLALRHCKSRLLGLRQTIALPVCAVGLILDYLSAGHGRLGAWIAGDEWP